MLTIFGYGQGLVMAPLSSAVLSTVKPVSAGAASGIYGTTALIIVYIAVPVAIKVIAALLIWFIRIEALRGSVRAEFGRRSS